MEQSDPGISNEARLQTASRTLQLLALFVERSAHGWTLTECSQRLGLRKSTVSRMLVTLVATGYLVREEASRRYRLGPVAIAIGAAALASRDVQHIALPIMRVLTEQTGETSLLHVVRGGEALCIEKVESSQAVRVSYDVGSRGPLYAGGSGKSLLAFLPANGIDAALARFDFRAYTEQTPSDPFTLRAELLEAQRLGYAESSGEMDPGVSSVGVPVIDGTGTVQGSITVVCPTTRWSGAHRTSCISAALEAASAVRAQLTGSAAPAGVSA